MRRMRVKVCFFILLSAAIVLLAAGIAEAEIRIDMPRSDSINPGGYICSDTSGEPIQYQIYVTAAGNQGDAPCRLWLRLLRNGKPQEPEYVIPKATGYGDGLCYNDIRTYTGKAGFGVFTLQAQLDVPEYRDGTAVYHVNKSNFKPETSVTFTVTHDHSFANGTVPTWEEEYTTDVPATCEEKGSESIHCSFCGASQPGTAREIPATGHEWHITCTWNADNTSVTANAVCAHDPKHTAKETAAPSVKTVRAPTAKTVGTIRYTAVFKNRIFGKQEKEVTVPKGFLAGKITLNKASGTLTITSKKKNPTLQLKAVVAPKNASVKAVTWKSSNPKIAAVDSSGKVTALKPGTVTITCTAHDGSKVRATCRIKVTNRLVTKITLNKKKATLKKGKTLQLKIKSILPKDVVNRNVKWKSSNRKVAAVDKNGKVTAKGPGTCLIICTAADGSKVVAQCRITVK